MKSIKIIYNSNSFSQIPLIQEISLTSEFNYNSNYTIQSGNRTIEFKTRIEIFDFFEQIKGLNPNEISLFLLRNNYKNWNNATFYEVQALKSLLLNFHWFELSISNHKELDIDKIFYNEFIIDWNYQTNPQNTIYLISKSYITDLKLENNLQKLVELTLLCEIKLSLPNKVLNNFFIPLLTPGISIDFFKSNFDKNGNKTHDLWKQLLEDKSQRINYWLKNRF